jgi:hypothetical protein
MHLGLRDRQVHMVVRDQRAEALDDLLRLDEGGGHPVCD